MNEFSNEEIGILVDALDAWVNRKESGALMVGLLTALVAKDDPMMKAKQAEEKRAAEIERKLDADTATLLKAKLIKFRQTIGKPPLEVTEEHREQGATDMERAYPHRRQP